MGTRVLSLWLPYLAIDRQGHEKAPSSSAGSRLPRAAFLETVDGQPLAALCPRAERAGLVPGMTRAEAMKRVPGLLTHPSDPESEREQLSTCASWCERYTPFVAIDSSFPAEKGGALWLDIGSSAHLAGGEASLLADLLGRFRKNGIIARAAIADHPGSAWAACRFGGDEQRILPPNGARVALAPWPLDALRLDKADCDALASAGIDRIEHLYALPRRSLAARFGDHVATRLDQALGLVDEPIAVDTPLPAQQAQMIFAEPITGADALSSLIERLLHQLCIGLEAAGLGARRLTLALYRVDNSTVSCSIGADRPSRDVRRLAALIGEKVRKIDLGFGLERAILDAVEIEPLLPESVSWRGLGTAADDVLPDLARRERPAHSIHQGMPSERASRRAVSSSPAQRQLQPAALPVSGGRFATALALAPEDVERPIFRETLPRPLRLLRQPEPIEAIASLPDEPPVLFRWRGCLHKVTGAKGPETVAPDWWRLPETERPSHHRNEAGRAGGGSQPRDYFAVEDSEGARFWLFREGRYDGAPGTLPRWYLHGVFS